MPDSTKIFSRKIGAALAPHGAIATFCRETGLHRETVDRWIEGKSSPTLRNVDAAAKGIGAKPWDMIKPDEIAVPRDEIRQAVREELAAQRMQPPEERAERSSPAQAGLPNLGGDIEALLPRLPEDVREEVRVHLEQIRAAVREELERPKPPKPTKDRQK